MSRLLFSKEGKAVYISHLDLMRVFQRSFRRAGLMLKHTQGFTPHAMVSIALPLSVGVSSRCEMLDYDLAEGQEVPVSEVARRLNEALPEGIRVLKAYDGGRKVRELALLEAKIVMEYDRGIPEGAEEAIGAMFARENLFVEKKGKNGPMETDILPMIRKWELCREDGQTLTLTCLVCAQNPSLNPALIPAAIGRYAEEAKPDFSAIHRVDVYCQDGTLFR